jgi:pyridoxine/pyridoxamine 5'-phosphate oxidase
LRVDLTFLWSASAGQLRINGLISKTHTFSLHEYSCSIARPQN